MLAVLKRRFLRTAALSALALGLTGCAEFTHQIVAADEAPVIIGPSVRDNRTPLDSAYRCYGAMLAQRLPAPLAVGVGEVRDYTGKYSDYEGSAITQGASPMLFSALSKLGDAVRVHERFDTRVAELELAYLEKRRLGTGDSYQVDGKVVPWMPYYGGSILKSGYYIVGGITELNYNIQSGGAEARVSQTGPKARTYTMSVAADLRLVNTKTLVVESAVSVQKQITGYEVGFELFRFFGSGSESELVDVNIGTKSQEPLQLGVRAVLELGTLKLLGDVSGVDYTPCLPDAWRIPSDADLIAAAEKGAAQAAVPSAGPPAKSPPKPVARAAKPGEAAAKVPTPRAKAAAPSAAVAGAGAVAGVFRQDRLVPEQGAQKQAKAASVAVQRVSYRVAPHFVAVRIESDGPLKYRHVAERNRISLTLTGATARDLRCESLPANVAIRDSWCGGAMDGVLMWWQGNEPLVVVRERALTPDLDGTHGLSLMIMRRSKLLSTSEGDMPGKAAPSPKPRQAATAARSKLTAQAISEPVARPEPDEGRGEVSVLATADIAPSADPLVGAPSLTLIE